MASDVISEKSFKFASRCIRLHLYLSERRSVCDISRQLLRSGTSIGANVREGLFAQTKADFLTKYSIAKKEASECLYWIELLKDTEILTMSEADSMICDCKELLSLLIATCKTTAASIRKLGKV
ncbi:MAG: four helix bundle protein [Muribaculaceae bacterium]|nr:four helix bundle protein [Muribaculaceae bacterium]